MQCDGDPAMIRISALCPNEAGKRFAMAMTDCGERRFANIANNPTVAPVLQISRLAREPH